MADQSASPPPHATMMQMITGKWVSQAIYAAAELGIADLLATREQTAEELAVATNTHADTLYRLLRALGSVGVLIEGEQRRFRNSPLGDTLRRDVPGSVRGFARLMGMDMSWKAWGEILYSVKTGQSAFERVAGKTAFEYISTRPFEAQIINEAMTSISEQTSQMVVHAYDFSGARMIIDVGGGEGLLLATILKANPQANGVLFELPHACAAAKDLLAMHGLTERVEVISGNALESVSCGGDIFIMKHIVHDWDNERSLQFMRNCAKAMPSGGKLLLLEAALTPPDTPHFAKLLDLEMLVMSPGGRERTIDEYRHLYVEAGLRMTQIYSTEGMLNIIEGVKP